MKKDEISVQNQKLTEYRIGEYARYMGVTHDFLKHYENVGLVQPTIKENGYRYYPFNQSSKILECMRLRNYGFSLRDMKEILYQDGFATVMGKMDRQTMELEKQIHFMQEVLKEHKKMVDWMNRRGEKQTDWKILDIDEMYFLPHSNNYDFIKDDRIYEIMQDWVSCMPMVKSCARYCLPENAEDVQDKESDRIWGLIAEGTFVSRQKLPLNSIVQKIPAGKVFLYEFVDCLLEVDQWRDLFLLLALEQMKQLGLKHRGEIYQVLLMYAYVEKAMKLTGYIIIPLA